MRRNKSLYFFTLFLSLSRGLRSSVIRQCYTGLRCSCCHGDVARQRSLRFSRASAYVPSSDGTSKDLPHTAACGCVYKRGRGVCVYQHVLFVNMRDAVSQERESKRQTLSRPWREEKVTERQRECKSGWLSHTSLHTLKKRERNMCGCAQRQELVFLCIISQSYRATNEAGTSLIHPVALALAWQDHDVTSLLFIRK